MNAQQKQIAMAAAGVVSAGVLFLTLCKSKPAVALVPNAEEPAKPAPAAEAPVEEKVEVKAEAAAPASPPPAAAAAGPTVTKKEDSPKMSRKASVTVVIPVGSFVRSRNLKDEDLNGLVGKVTVCVKVGEEATGKATVKFQDGKKRLIKQANLVRIEESEYNSCMELQAEHDREEVLAAEKRAKAM